MPTRYCLRVLSEAQPEAFALDPLRPVCLIGRGPDADLAFADRTVSRRHCRLVHSGAQYQVEDLGSRLGTLLNGVPVRAPTALAAGDTLRLGAVTLCFEAEASDDETLPVDPAAPPTVAANALAATDLDAAEADEIRPLPAPEPGVTRRLRASESECAREVGIPIRLSSGPCTIGRDCACEVPLDAPTLSRHHAVLEPTAGGYQVCDLDSANGTYVNGARVRGTAALAVGDTLRLGPYELEFTGYALRSRNAETGARIEVCELGKQLPAGHTQPARWLLRDISLRIQPREFVGVLGLSGSGKSTLMDALNGRRPATAGRILYDGQELYACFNAFKRTIGYVPQRLILHEALPVEAVLRYACRLRLPPDTRPEEINANIDRVLALVQLSHRRETRVADLSGGEQKRVAIAMELLSRPTVLFLDEATSGLDQVTETQLMGLFRTLANSGVTTLCISHYADSLDACDKVIYVVAGRLAFFGPPRAMKRHFGVRTLRDVLLLQATQTPEEWERRFRASPYYARYVGPARPAGGEIAPLRRPGADVDPRRAALRQFHVLLRRHVHVLWCDPRTLLITLLLAPLISVLLGLALAPPADLDPLVARVRARAADLGDPWRVYDEMQRQLHLGFVAITAMFFLGLFGAIRAIVKELPIYRHERFIGLGVLPYLGSKVVPLTGLVAIQALELQVLLGPLGHPLYQSDGWAAGGQLAILTLTGFAALLLGLALSAAVRREDTAIALMVAVIIPQILFSDALRPLSGLARALGAWLVPARAALDASQALVAVEFRAFAKPHVTLNVLRLLAFSAAYSGAALLLLRSNDQPGKFPQSRAAWYGAWKTRLYRCHAVLAVLITAARRQAASRLAACRRWIAARPPARIPRPPAPVADAAAPPTSS